MIEFPTDGTCPICKYRDAKLKIHSNDSAKVDCHGCGYFLISPEAYAIVDSLHSGDRTRLAGAVYEANSRSRSQGKEACFQVLSDGISALLSGAPEPFDIPVKVRKLLAAIARASAKPGEQLEWDLIQAARAAFAADGSEARYLLRYAQQSGWIEYNPGGPHITIKLSPAGWEEIRHRPRIESAQGFVAMWFGGDDHADMMADAYENGFRTAIEVDAHYKAMRIDGKEFNGDIVDEIMAEIRESRFVVADLTGHRGGVYFEGGFAKGLGIDVIWTCHADDAGKTHFDTNHQKQIRWTTTDDLRRQLSARIRATIGPGPLQPTEVR